MISWQIGDVKVTRVLEQEVALPASGLIANLVPERLAEHAPWLKPHFMTDDDEIRLSIHALIVESGDETIVVDTCMGNDRPLPQGSGPLQTSFLEELESVVEREEVEYVLCTHLHTGDMVHHPVQLAEPTWGSHPDSLPELAVQTRRDFVARNGDEPVLVIGTHFAAPTAGRIVKVGDSCRFETD